MTQDTQAGAGAQPAPAQQPEALRLAEFLEARQTRLGSWRGSCDEYDRQAWDDYIKAWELLRSQHARIAELEAQAAAKCLHQGADAAAVAALKGLLSLVRREAPQLSGKVLGNAESAIAALQAAPPLNPVEPGALHASIRELDAWESRADGNELTPSESESVVLVLHELKRLQAAPPAPAAVAVPADLAKRIKDCAAHWAYMERIDHGDQAAVEKKRHTDLVDQLAAAPAQEHATQLAGQG